MKTITLGLVWMVSGCALDAPHPASPYYAYTAGWVVQLNKPLTIPRMKFAARSVTGSR